MEQRGRSVSRWAFQLEGFPVVGHFFKDLRRLNLEAFSLRLWWFGEEPLWKRSTPGSQHSGNRKWE